MQENNKLTETIEGKDIMFSMSATDFIFNVNFQDGNMYTSEPFRQCFAEHYIDNNVSPAVDPFIDVKEITLESSLKKITFKFEPSDLDNPRISMNLRGSNITININDSIIPLEKIDFERDRGEGCSRCH